MGPIGSALFYAILISIPSVIIGVFWQMAASWFSFLSGDGGEALFSIGQAMVLALLMPIIVPIVLIISSAITHLMLMILGGANRSLVATFRVMCYSSAPDLLQIIPVCGSVIGAIWGLLLIVIGLKEVHQTSWVKASTAVILPFILCCGIPLMLGLFLGMMGALD